MRAPDLPLLPKNPPIPFGLAAADEAELQAFFEANPAYFLAVQGAPAGPQAAYDEIHGDLPAGWSCTKKWLIGYRDPVSGKLVAFASLVSDLLADTVWHIESPRVLRRPPLLRRWSHEEFLEVFP